VGHFSLSQEEVIVSDKKYFIMCKSSTVRLGPCVNRPADESLSEGRRTVRALQQADHTPVRIRNRSADRSAFAAVRSERPRRETVPATSVERAGKLLVMRAARAKKPKDAVQDANARGIGNLLRFEAAGADTRSWGGPYTHPNSTGSRELSHENQKGQSCIPSDK
jgi:hypothetical protein